MPIRLAEVPLPEFGVPELAPDIPATTYATRADTAYGRAGCDWLVVYADREHFGNMMYLTGFEPRFEEALLLLGPGGRRVLLVGNESESYAALARLPDLTVMRAQSLSLLGQDRSLYPRLADRLADAGIKKGDRVGLVGWKYLEPEEDPDYAEVHFLPHAIVAMLWRIIGPAGEITDASRVLMDSVSGLRATVDVDQIAAFEWAAARCSSALWPVIVGARPGETEFQAVSRLAWRGDPTNVHTMFASASKGDSVIGLRSATARTLAKGDGVTTALGYWGALSSRAGLLDEANDEFFDIARTYFAGLMTWYETAGIGVSGGNLFSAVTGKLAEGNLNSALNPGHLGSHEEWMHSPVRPGSNETIASGMVFQVDVIPTPLPDGWALNCEDAIVFADAALRDELARKHPDAWQRIRARRQFMADQLGVALKPDILPLSAAPLYLPPFWLRPNQVLVAS